MVHVHVISVGLILRGKLDAVVIIYCTKTKETCYECGFDIKG